MSGLIGKIVDRWGTAGVVMHVEYSTHKEEREFRLLVKTADGELHDWRACDVKVVA